MKKQESFSLHKRWKSFGFAINGLRLALSSEHNLWVHLFATLLVIIGAIFFHVSPAEALALCLSIWLVWCMELINTAIEKVMDFISTEIHPSLKKIKDIAAAAVLVAAITAIIIGCVVFIPKIF
jgi:diacylglycerol kinase (ATP)